MKIFLVKILAPLCLAYAWVMMVYAIRITPKPYWITVPIDVIVFIVLIMVRTQYTKFGKSSKFSISL